MIRNNIYADTQVILLPLMREHDTRKAICYAAFADSNILNDLDFSGSSAYFTPHLIQVVITEYPELFITLLKEAARYCGQEDKEAIEEIKQLCNGEWQKELLPDLPQPTTALELVIEAPLDNLDVDGIIEKISQNTGSRITKLHIKSPTKDRTVIVVVMTVIAMKTLEFAMESAPKMLADALGVMSKLRIEPLRQEDWINSLIDIKRHPDPRVRAEIGQVLGQTNPLTGEPLDNRKGVSVMVRDGVKLPDIDWVTIDSDETWIYQDEKHEPLPPFAISRYPVTYAQFQCFADAPDYNDDRWWVGMPDEQEFLGTNYRTRELSEQRFKFWNHPRENVSWYQAVAFCRWLSDKLGTEITLPTEQQWERAARGTDGRLYPYEGEYDPAKGNTDDTSIRQTSAVGIFPHGASPEGVLDMSGNVWEWCVNKYENPEEIAVDDSGVRRVLRGGAWNFPQVNARAVYRSFSSPSYRLYYYGFRLVVVRP